MVGPARWLAGQSTGGKPAPLYHFSYVGSRFRPMGVTTAAHAAEIQYVFEYWGRRTPLSMVAADDRAMADLMHGCWVAFAKTGAPKCAIVYLSQTEPATSSPSSGRKRRAGGLPQGPARRPRAGRPPSLAATEN